MNPNKALWENGRMNELHSQLLDLAKSQNTNSSGGTSIAATFLRVTVSL